MAGGAGVNEIVGAGRPRPRAGIDEDRYVGGGGGQEGIVRVGENWYRNWDIKDTEQLSTFKGQSLVPPLTLLSNRTSPPYYGHSLGTWRPV